MGGKIKETLFNHLIDAERQLLEPEVRQSAEALDALLDDDFIEWFKKEEDLKRFSHKRFSKFRIYFIRNLLYL